MSMDPSGGFQGAKLRSKPQLGALSSGNNPQGSGPSATGFPRRGMPLPPAREARDPATPVVRDPRDVPQPGYLDELEKER